MESNPDSLHVLYVATAPLAVPLIDLLLETPWIGRVTVVSQPDRPQGRRRKLAPSPVKARALERGLDVLTPEKIGSSGSIETLKERAPDVMAVFAYGQYLPRRAVELFPLGAINVHPSLLPRWRGASPIQHTLLHGDSIAGVSIIGVAEEMDAGDIYAQEEVAITDSDNAATLADRLAAIGGALLIDVVDALRNGTANPTAQPEEGITVCSKLAKEDGRLNWNDPAEQLWHRIRALQPWPGGFTAVPDWDGPLKITSARPEDVESEALTGTLISVSGDGPLISCGTGALRLTGVQPPGKNAMPGDAFLRGAHWEVGMRLGEG